MATQSPLASRVMATQYRSHAYRRQRNRNSMEAAVALIHDQAAALQAVQLSAAQSAAVCKSWDYISSEDAVFIQAEVANRLVHIAPAIRAQVHAAAYHGQEHHSARLLIDADAHIMGNAAKHQFDATIYDINPQRARKQQRQKSKCASGVFAAPDVSGIGVFAAPVHDDTGTGVFAAPVFDEGIYDATGAGVFAAPVHNEVLLECQSCHV